MIRVRQSYDDSLLACLHSDTILLGVQAFRVLAIQGDSMPKIHCSVTKVFAILQHVHVYPFSLTDSSMIALDETAVLQFPC